MVETQSMVLEERIASEIQRLKLKYFGDRSLEMAIPAPVSSTYQGLSGEEAAEVVEDFYYKWRFHVFVLRERNVGPVFAPLWKIGFGVHIQGKGKVRMVRTQYLRIRHAAEGRLAINTAEVQERIFGLLGYDTELPMRACQLEGLDTRSREIEYSHYFYESFFFVFIRDSVERERYKASDMESGKDALALESRMVRARNNKCQPHERERITSSSFSPNNCFITKNLESTQRERQKIRGINQELSEDDKRLKWAKGRNSPAESLLKMGRLYVGEVSISSRKNESDNGGEGGLEQFPGFPGQLVSYPLGSDTLREFCKAKDLEAEKRDRGIDESISLEYFDEDVQSDLSKGFLCYLFQLEYGLSLPLTNLAKGVMNAIGACPVQMNENMWEVITVCDHLNDRWEKEKKVGRITPEDVLQFYGVNNFKASGGPYFCVSVTRHLFLYLNSACRTWNDNIIWVKGNCLQRDDEELLDLRFRSVKQSMKSTVERKKSLLDKIVEEETELKLVLGKLGLSRIKRVKCEKVAEGRSASVDDLKEVEERARLVILQGKDDTSQMVVHHIKEIWLVKQLKAAHAIAINQLQVEAKANLDEMAEEHDRLGRHLMLKGYSQEEVDAIMADTYGELEEVEADVLGVVDGLDGVSPQTVLDNQRGDVEFLEGESEKQFDRMKEANENREDQYVKAHFRLEKLNQVISDLTRQVEEEDSGIKKGFEDLSAAIKRANNFQYQVNELAVKGKEADMAQNRIQALERTERSLRKSIGIGGRN
ncbi:hypothetical protein GIB67_001547 [Kingdonia uniflora]|uniref:Uncharacterized protein n=1 Tax=Kingdonia uniflora TaxID=39325 RepID=A0A7J7L6Z9_9MAGN|nr:hypothetical protein GIB67_001547 [Kingdonia uniflora]